MVIVAEPQLTVVAFRLDVAGLSGGETNAINEELLELINNRTRVYLSGSTVRGEFVLRICILSFRTHKERLEQGLEDIRNAVGEVTEGGGE
jgi:aromatic-L-amino-acid decarboxylase